MERGTRDSQNPLFARAFVLTVSLASSAVVWLAVVNALGYTILTGFLYFIGYCLAMILFFEALGYSLLGR
ncbi:MAG: hypothetical protein NTZ78_07640 [Candidatus Aureabacteria bacterium]|nr:hypothetical protein [Candidatus Auribacterota bacterium]